jgi:hypothetical protein
MSCCSVSVAVLGGRRTEFAAALRISTPIVFSWARHCEPLSPGRMGAFGARLLLGHCAPHFNTHVAPIKCPFGAGLGLDAHDSHLARVVQYMVRSNFFIKDLP